MGAHLIVLSKTPSPEEAADSAHSIARAAVASGRQELYGETRPPPSYASGLGVCHWSLEFGANMGPWMSEGSLKTWV
ncbi:hypothetical protein U0070_000705 [Myodes glareolus]|uniref:Uncharacterized protein n=1 Tax=Myodes glareolus TaxID=447135 RepID=A0AAW0J7B9_MYOGA